MNTSKRIVVVQSGWVLMGDYAYNPETQCAVIENSYVVRKWGTTDGLGQLALIGPTDETVTDASGTAEIPKLAVLFTLEIFPKAQASWEQFFKRPKG